MTGRLLRVIDIHNNSLHIPMLFLKNLVAVFCHRALQIRGERWRGGKGVFPLFHQSGRNGKLHRRRRKPQRGCPARARCTTISPPSCEISAAPAAMQRSKRRR